MSESVNDVDAKFKDFKFPNMRLLLGETEFARHRMYLIMSETKIDDRHTWRYVYQPNRPITSVEMQQSLFAVYLPAGTRNEPFATTHMEVWRALLHLVGRYNSPAKYSFYYGRFINCGEYEMLEDMVKFYGIATSRSYSHFVPNVYFSVYRKKLHNCLRVQYATSASEGNLFDFTVLLPYSYNPKLYVLIGFILMMRSYDFELRPRDLVSDSEMFDKTISPSDYHGCGDFFLKDPVDSLKLDVLDLAFFEKFAPQFYLPCRDTLVALCYHRIDTNVEPCPYIASHNCDQEDFSDAFPMDSEDGFALKSFLLDYDPMLSILARASVGFK